MEHYRCHKPYITKKRAERISDIEGFPLKTIIMPQMTSMDETYHAAQSFIYALQNPEPAISLVKLGNGNKEALMTLVEIFKKTNPPAVLPRVPVRKLGQKKLQEVNQEGTQMKSAPQSNPLTNA